MKRLPGKPGSPEFMEAYNAALSERKAVPKETLRALVVEELRHSYEAGIGASLHHRSAQGSRDKALVVAECDIDAFGQAGGLCLCTKTFLLGAVVQL